MHRIYLSGCYFDELRKLYPEVSNCSKFEDAIEKLRSLGYKVVESRDYIIVGKTKPMRKITQIIYGEEGGMSCLTADGQLYEMYYGHWRKVDSQLWEESNEATEPQS